MGPTIVQYRSSLISTYHVCPANLIRPSGMPVASDVMYSICEEHNKVRVTVIPSHHQDDTLSWGGLVLSRDINDLALRCIETHGPNRESI